MGGTLGFPLLLDHGVSEQTAISSYLPKLVQLPDVFPQQTHISLHAHLQMFFILPHLPGFGDGASTAAWPWKHLLYCSVGTRQSLVWSQKEGLQKVILVALVATELGGDMSDCYGGIGGRT